MSEPKRIVEEELLSDDEVDKSKSKQSSSDDSSSGDDSSSDGSSDDSSSDDSADSSESEESDANQGSKKRALKTSRESAPKRVRKFFEEEAGEASEDEEYEGEEDDERRERRDRDLERLRREMASRKEAGSHRLKSVIERIEERAKDDQDGTLAVGDEPSGEYLEAYSDSENADAIGGRLPTLEDDKLFMVRMTEPGKERAAIAQLTVKAKEMLQTGQTVPVRSFFSTDSLRGYVYIEAPSEGAVKSFISGIRRLQSYSAKIVPFSEQLGVFRAAARAAEEKLAKLSSGEWIRVKSRKWGGGAGVPPFGFVYGGDLGRVVHDSGDGWIEVEVVPRLSAKSGSGGMRPVAAFFDPSTIETRGWGDVERIRDPVSGEVYAHFHGERFSDNGYMLKRVLRTGVIWGVGVEPREDEIRRFIRSEDELAVALKNRVTDSISPSIVYKLGDRVQATSTDMRGVQGEVISVDSSRSRLTIKVKTAGVSLPPVEFSFSDVCKIFALGDRVKILSGAEEGETGLVTKAVFRDKSTSSVECCIVLDGDGREVGVNPSMLALTGEISKGVTSVGGLGVGDLVKFRAGEVGVIVRASKGGALVILASDGSRHNVSVSETAHGKIDQRDVFAVSREGEAFGVDSQVKILGGAEQSGTVKFIIKSSVFIKIRDRVEDAGFVVIPSKNVSVLVTADTVGNRGGRGGSFAAKPVATQASRPVENPSRQPRSEPSRFSAIDRLVGARVRIIKGTFKGYIATVRDVQDTKVQVSLEAKFKVLTLPKDHVRGMDSEKEIEDVGVATSLHAPMLSSLHRPPVRETFIDPRTPAPAEFMPADEEDEPVALPVAKPESFAWMIPGAVVEKDGERLAVAKLEGPDRMRVRVLSQPGVYRTVEIQGCKRSEPRVGDRVKVIGKSTGNAAVVGELLGFQSGSSGDQNDAIILAAGDVKVVDRNDVIGWAP